METTMNQQETKTFIWSMLGSDFIEKFERFNKLALVKGKHVTTLLAEMVENHVSTENVEGTLVDEKELMENLESANISVSRVTLRNYRVNEKLVWEGKTLYFTDGRNICYHLEGCMAFFEHRKRNSLSSLRD